MNIIEKSLDNLKDIESGDIVVVRDPKPLKDNILLYGPLLPNVSVGDVLVKFETLDNSVKLMYIRDHQEYEYY